MIRVGKEEMSVKCMRVTFYAPNITKWSSKRENYIEQGKKWNSYGVMEVVRKIVVSID